MPKSHKNNVEHRYTPYKHLDHEGDATKQEHPLQELHTLQASCKNNEQNEGDCTPEISNLLDCVLSDVIAPEDDVSSTSSDNDDEERQRFVVSSPRVSRILQNSSLLSSSPFHESQFGTDVEDNTDDEYEDINDNIASQISLYRIEDNADASQAQPVLPASLIEHKNFDALESCSTNNETFKSGDDMDGNIKSTTDAGELERDEQKEQTDLITQHADAQGAAHNTTAAVSVTLAQNTQATTSSNLISDHGNFVEQLLQSACSVQRLIQNAQRKYRVKTVEEVMHHIQSHHIVIGDVEKYEHMITYKVIQQYMVSKPCQLGFPCDACVLLQNKISIPQAVNESMSLTLSDYLYLRVMKGIISMPIHGSRMCSIADACFQLSKWKLSQRVTMVHDSYIAFLKVLVSDRVETARNNHAVVNEGIRELRSSHDIREILNNLLCDIPQNTEAIAVSIRHIYEANANIRIAKYVDAIGRMFVGEFALDLLSCCKEELKSTLTSAKKIQRTIREYDTIQAQVCTLENMKVDIVMHALRIERLRSHAIIPSELANHIEDASAHWIYLLLGIDDIITILIENKYVLSLDMINHIVHTSLMCHLAVKKAQPFHAPGNQDNILHYLLLSKQIVTADMQEEIAQQTLRRHRLCLQRLDTVLKRVSKSMRGRQEQANVKTAMSGVKLCMELFSKRDTAKLRSERAENIAVHLNALRSEYANLCQTLQKLPKFTVVKLTSGKNVTYKMQAINNALRMTTVYDAISAAHKHTCYIFFKIATCVQDRMMSGLEQLLRITGQIAFDKIMEIINDIMQVFRAESRTALTQLLEHKVDNLHVVCEYEKQYVQIAETQKKMYFMRHIWASTL